MDMASGTCNNRSLYAAGCITTTSKELSKYKLDLVGVQEVKWEGDGTEPTEEYTFFYVFPVRYGCICVFRMALTINSDCFPKQLKPVGLCRGDVMCF
jgi:hypothetical protein